MILHLARVEGRARGLVSYVTHGQPHLNSGKGGGGGGEGGTENF